MDPQIRYVRAADGVNIATHRLGEGMPGVPVVIVPPYAIGTFNSDWQVADVREGFTRFARRRPIINYDARGAGLSDRDVDEIGLEERVADLAAVVESTGAPLIHLLSRGPGSLPAIAYAARYPDRVSRMILSAGIARGTDFRPNPARRALMPLADSNWEVFLQASALVDFGWDEGKVFAQDLLRNASRDAWMKTIRANRSIDVTDCLPKVTCPVLVIHSRWRNDEEDLPLAAVRGVAAALPNARLVEVDYLSPMIFHGHVDEHLRIFESFFAEDEPVHYAHLGLSSGTAVILFTDIADSTALTERMGDAVFRAASRSLDAALRDAMRDAGGAPVEGKVLGDGVMAVFASAAQAIAAALRCIELSAEGGLQLHAGLHAGDVIREADNVYGGAVNIASRICGLSAPGEILVSATVRDLARTSAGVAFEDRGDHALKGIDDPVRVFAVRTEG